VRIYILAPQRAIAPDVQLNAARFGRLRNLEANTHEAERRASGKTRLVVVCVSSVEFGSREGKIAAVDARFDFGTYRVDEARPSCDTTASVVVCAFRTGDELSHA
jgi:hypothetical protein